ncbi:amidoligase family protein [Bernardetia sp.]|uniref:amidoligase family protein n=1 Tax=Bernardetia sp. TaxID=1937974 RepID=UPI0025BCFAE2|nr:amidoligase family protein [Bernardetia sp.]
MIEQILALQTTKTEKIKQLLELGFTRTQVAELMGVGYGFVQNVYAKYVSNQTSTRGNTKFKPIHFNRQFGVEIEAYNVTKAKLKRELIKLGIRVEIENYNHTTKTHWKIITDASIRGANGFEIVSPILKGEDGLEQLKKVCQALKNCNAYINKSCGLHIHFDASQFKLKQFKNILLNYASLENVIDMFLPNSRRANNNNYCKSIINHKSAIENASTIHQLTAAIPQRYNKLNTKSYTKYKTIEFRHHSGTVEFDKIHNWIVFLHNLVEYSKDKRVSQVHFETLKTFNQPKVYTYLNNRKEELAA